MHVSAKSALGFPRGPVKCLARRDLHNSPQCVLVLWLDNVITEFIVNLARPLEMRVQGYIYLLCPSEPSMLKVFSIIDIIYYLF